MSLPDRIEAFKPPTTPLSNVELEAVVRVCMKSIGEVYNSVLNGGSEVIAVDDEVAIVKRTFRIGPQPHNWRIARSGSEVWFSAPENVIQTVQLLLKRASIETRLRNATCLVITPSASSKHFPAS